MRAFGSDEASKGDKLEELVAKIHPFHGRDDCVSFEATLCRDGEPVLRVLNNGLGDGDKLTPMANRSLMDIADFHAAGKVGQSQRCTRKSVQALFALAGLVCRQASVCDYFRRFPTRSCNPEEVSRKSNLEARKTITFGRINKGKFQSCNFVDFPAARLAYFLTGLARLGGFTGWESPDASRLLQALVEIL